MKNYYAILEVPVGCSLEEIRQAYHRLVQMHLDDESVFADLKEAYEVLSTPTRRQEYDQAAWGGTFDDAGPLGLLVLPTMSALGRCPMGADAQCPVQTGQTSASDTYCPDCGYALAGLTAGSAFDPESRADAARRAWLEDQSGRTYPLLAGSNAVGRESGDILVPDKTVSRAHARLEVAEDGSVLVEDLGSTNGTQVNDERLLPHASRSLAGGDRLRFGSVGFVLRRAAPETEAAPTMQADAQVVETTGSGRVFSLMPGLTAFGRRPENTVVLAGDPYVSGSHAQILADSGGVYILTDLGSTNGTLLNGERLAPNRPVTLDPGDVILIGGTALRFEHQAAPVAEAPTEEEVPAELTEEPTEEIATQHLEPIEKSDTAEG